MLIAWTPLARRGQFFFQLTHLLQQLIGTLSFPCMYSGYAVPSRVILIT
jgi:hypothetical protein